MSFWGSGGSRRNYDEGFDCPSCNDYTSFDDSAECSCCCECFCSDCVGIECTGCKERSGTDGLYQICEGCLPYPGCEACNDEDITFCKECISDHLKNCNNTSRAKRIINSETNNIQMVEKRIAELRSEITSRENELNMLQGNLDAAKKRKVDAEEELKKEGEGSTKKQKTEQDN